jgi:hypothetical protein
VNNLFPFFLSFQDSKLAGEERRCNSAAAVHSIEEERSAEKVASDSIASRHQSGFSREDEKQSSEKDLQMSPELRELKQSAKGNLKSIDQVVEKDERKLLRKPSKRLAASTDKLTEEIPIPSEWLHQIEEQEAEEILLKDEAKDKGGAVLFVPLKRNSCVAISFDETTNSVKKEGVEYLNKVFIVGGESFDTLDALMISKKWKLYQKK